MPYFHHTYSKWKISEPPLLFAILENSENPSNWREIFYYEIGSLIRFLADLKYSKNLDYKDVQLALKAGLLVIYEKLFFWYGLGA